MFDYAISLNQKRRRTRRHYVAWVASWLAHALLIVILIQFPELLRGGRYHGFRPFALLTSALGPLTGDQDEGERWRTVTVIKDPEKMIAPSAAALRRQLGLDKPEGGPPVIKVQLGKDDLAAFNEKATPMPRMQEESRGRKDDDKRVVLPPPNTAAVAPPDPQSSKPNASSPSASAPIVHSEPALGRPGLMNIPPPGPPPTEPVASAPKPPGPASSTSGVRVFDDEQKAIRSSESGFFDTKGYPLGEYITVVKERIKGRWFIPSNLRDSKGRTTVIFYISKTGRYTDCRIAATSGSTSLDLAALKAVMDSDPFPPLPRDFPGKHIGAKFVFSYNETR